MKNVHDETCKPCSNFIWCIDKALFLGLGHSNLFTCLTHSEGRKWAILE